MKRAWATRAFAAAALAACSAHAQVDPAWEWGGSNSAHAEYYRTHGDPNGGPYQDVRGQYYDDIAFDFTRRITTLDIVRGQFRGVANDSIYRASDRGFIPERINLSRENGDSKLPYRAEIGDISPAFSFRTLQASLKGAQVDLQPLPQQDGAHTSIMIVTGTSQSSWRHLHAHDNWTTGASWLYETAALSHLSGNVVHNFRQADTRFDTPMRQQLVASIAGDTVCKWEKYALKFEGEVAGLHGDHDEGQDRRGTGVFAQVSGGTLPDPQRVDYRLRFERYDRDFRPVLGIVSADHRSEEAFVNWRWDGRTLGAKLQDVIDGMQTGNELKTRTAGLKLEGPWAADSTGSIEAYWQGFTKRDDSVDRATWNLTAYLQGKLSSAWTGNMTLSLQDMRDRVPGAYDTREARLELNVSRGFNVGSWGGTVSPTIVLRRLTGGPDAVNEVHPGLALSLARKPHEFKAGYSYQRLRPDATSVATVDVNQLQVSYTYTREPDTIGVEVLAYDRNVTVGQYNDTYRAAIYWTHTFGATPSRVARIVPAASYEPGSPLPRGRSLLLALAPGEDLDVALARLEGAGYRGATQGSLRVYEMRVIDDVENRQRFVVEGGAGRIARSGVIIDVADANDANSVAQAYERTRKALLDRFGSPANSFDAGSYGPTLVADLNAGRVVRATEWRSAQGTVRLGIPRRLDGRVRIEIQHAASLPAPREGRWSFEEIR